MNGDDLGKQKFIGGIDFEDLKAQRVQLYNTITINLATARSNEEHVFTGNYVYALEATDVDANLDLRFNEKFRGGINLTKGRGVRVPFYRFYVTNTAQAGKTITLAIGVESDSFEVFDVGKALGVTGTVSVAEQSLADDWCSEGWKLNPALGTVMADTGQLSAGYYDWWIICGSDSATVAMIDLEHRNAANDATLKTVAFNYHKEVGGVLFLKGTKIAANERMRCVMHAAITGTNLVITLIYRRTE